MAYRDLSLDEQRNVLDMLRALRARFGNWFTVEKALPISHSQRVEMTEGRTEVSTTIAFRIAKLLEVSLHDVIQGIALPKPTCPHCGKVLAGPSDEGSTSKWTPCHAFCYHRCMMQFPRWRVDVTVGGDVVKTFYETATTSAAAIAKAKHKMRGAVSSAGAFKFKAAKSDTGESERQHATKKPKIGYFIRSSGPGGVKFDEVYVYGPTRRSDEGIVGHDLRIRPTRLGPGTYTSVVSPDDVEWAKPAGGARSSVHHATKKPSVPRATKKSPAQLQHEIDEVLTRSPAKPSGSGATFQAMAPGTASSLRRDLVQELLARGEEPSAQYAEGLDNAEVAELARGRGKHVGGKIYYSRRDVTEMADAIEAG